MGPWPDPITQRLELLLQRCCDDFAVDPRPVLLPAIHARGHALGWVRRQGAQFRLSLSQEGLRRWPDTMANEVLPHELAHVVAMMRGHHRPAHGVQWQQVCTALGGSGSAHHKLPTTPARRSRQYEYTTPSGTLVWLGATRHARAERGTGYQLRAEPLSFTGRWRWKPFPSE